MPTKQVLFLDRHNKYALVEMDERDMHPTIYMHDVTAIRNMSIAQFARDETELAPLPRVRRFERGSTIGGRDHIGDWDFPPLVLYVERS